MNDLIEGDLVVPLAGEELEGSLEDPLLHVAFWCHFIAFMFQTDRSVGLVNEEVV